MITITDKAQSYFCSLLSNEPDTVRGVLLSVSDGGTARADVCLQFAQSDLLQGNEQSFECVGFTVFISANSVEWLKAAEIDYTTVSAGHEQLTIHAPHIKGSAPGPESDLIDQVRWVIDTEINPQLASHGGSVSVENVTLQAEVFVRFSGGCHGCGKASLTLNQGIETTLKQRIPEIRAVIDITDHQTGTAPYIPAASAL